MLLKKARGVLLKLVRDLIDMISRKPVNIDPVARDKYGRIVANVKVVNKSVNNAMRKKGWK